MSDKKPSEATPKSVMEMARKRGAKMVDVKFVDTFGTWQHFSVPLGELTVENITTFRLSAYALSSRH